ncbi:MAG: tetraacyldisaccharide 4'-kinase [Planctomycetota bacterium]
MASVTRFGLWFASIPYRTGVRHRNKKFDRGDGVHRVDVPVISVGNLTTGGTGKTPVVAYLARWFRDRGVRVAIVSRGYGRGDAAENDEAAELHQRLPDVPHLQDPDRVRSAEIAIEELDSQLILMDDGFQHRRLHRDLDIVLVDATCPFGYGHLLPRGLLREPMKNLSRADVAIVTRSDLVDRSKLQSLESRLSRLARPKEEFPIARCQHQPTSLLKFPHQTEAVESLYGKRVLLISGIGNPSAFEQTVEKLQIDVIDHYILADHASVNREVIDSIGRWRASFDDVDAFVCTQKDLVKFRVDQLHGIPFFCLVIEAQIDSSSLDGQLRQILSRVETESHHGH